VLVKAQIHASLNETNQNSADAVTFEKADAEVKTAKNLLRQLRATPQTALISDVVEEVWNLAPESITFKTIIVSDASGKVEKIQVQGVAPTRDVIARFKNSLESSPVFTKAEVPIADLARDVDVPFTVTITVAKDS
jgi:Tfp pilus assembly protein PilN